MKLDWFVSFKHRHLETSKCLLPLYHVRLMLVSHAVVNVDELKPNVEGEEEVVDDDEEEEEEENEEKEQPQPSTKSLLKDKEEEEKSDAEQDVSHDPDASSPTELCLSEEEAPDAQPPPSSKTSSRASSLDSPR